VAVEQRLFTVTACGCRTDRGCSQSQPLAVEQRLLTVTACGCRTDRGCSQSQPVAVEQTEAVPSHFAAHFAIHEPTLLWLCVIKPKAGPEMITRFLACNLTKHLIFPHDFRRQICGNTGCPTRYRTRHFCNNFTTNEDIAHYRHTVQTHSSLFLTQ